jgi:hypothetical protein
MWAQIVNTLIGIWLTASPDVFKYKDSGVDSNHILGPVIATIAMVACWEVTRGMRKWNVPLALWLVLAPWILGYDTTLPILNDMICGVIILSLSMVKGKIKGSYGGGWRSLWRSGDAVD